MASASTTSFASPFPVWAFDSRTATILDANHEAARVYGYTRMDLVHAAVDMLCRSAETAALLLTAVANAECGEVSWVGPLTWVRKNRSTFQADVGVLVPCTRTRQEAIVLLCSMHDADGGRDGWGQPQKT